MPQETKKFYLNKKIYIGAAGVIIAGILFLFLLDSYIMPAYTNYGEGITVPDVTRLSLEEAEQTLSAANLRYEVAERRSNEAFPANYVIDQTPTPTEIVKPNRKIYLTVNVVSNPTVQMPEVTDMSLRNARIQIENAGLKLGTISYESSRFKNTVLRQSIAPNETVAQGTMVDLVVSDGLGQRMVDVPDIIGLRLTEAQQKLRSNGLRIGEVSFRPSKEVPPNVILDYAPKVEQLTEGQSLELVVSERFNVEEEDEAGAIVDTTDTKDSTPEQ